jgi:hypothetical protein
MNENFLSIFNQKKNFDKKSSRKSEEKKRIIHIDYSILHSLFTLLSRHLCALSSRLL